jgi:hypothetical protein
MSNTRTDWYPEFATPSTLRTEVRFADGNSNSKAATAKRPGVLNWYRILRVHYRFPLFEAIRIALWLAR